MGYLHQIMLLSPSLLHFFYRPIVLLNLFMPSIPTK